MFVTEALADPKYRLIVCPLCVALPVTGQAMPIPLKLALEPFAMFPYS